MLSDFLKANYKSQAKFVEYGYGQVEPNHLSAQRTGQIYAQLPAKSDINVLEQGQFVKYDYAAENGGEVNFTGKGEWMLVYNEIKLYRDNQVDCEFAMVKDNYQARIYSPYDWEQPEAEKQSRYYDGKDAEGNTSITIGATPKYTKTSDSEGLASKGKTYYETKDGGLTYTAVADPQDGQADNYYEMTMEGGKTYAYDDVTAGKDPYELHYNEDPFHFLGGYKARKMPEGTTMVPRVFKTNVGDIFTTNTINEESVSVGDELGPDANGILAKSGDTTSMKWQVVRVYTMPDGQKGAKVMRIA